MFKTLPKVNKYGSPDKSDGSIDPLGIYPISEQLAQKMVSGVRERQKHPRFLTIMALSKLLEIYLKEEEEEEDLFEVEPWQSFEWIIVQLFTKVDSELGEEGKGLSGLPGNLKAKRVLKDRGNFSEASYLNVPSIFGFHGVYKILAKDTKLITKDRLHDVGHELLNAWAKDQRIDGFLKGSHGQANLRRKLIRLVKKGCKEGHACMKPLDYKTFQFLYDNLHHREIGKRESDILWNLLIHDPETHRGEILSFINSLEGKKCLQESISKKGERHFHKGLYNVSSKKLKVLLQAIFEYERFARLLDNTFSEIMDALSRSSNSIHALAKLTSSESGHKKVKNQYSKTLEALRPLDMSSHFSELFENIRNFNSVKDYVRVVIDHHFKIQEGKGSKGVWIFPYKNNSYSLNRIFKKEFKSFPEDTYVNFYRMHSLRQFSIDLGRIKTDA